MKMMTIPPTSSKNSRKIVNSASLRCDPLGYYAVPKNYNRIIISEKNPTLTINRVIRYKGNRKFLMMFAIEKNLVQLHH